MEINQAAPKFQDASIAPMHTTEHIVNRTMVNLFGCERAVSAHIERKKSKLDFALPTCPTKEEINRIEKIVNETLKKNLPITTEFITQEEAVGRFDLKRLPDHASETVRVVHVGDYDECLCIGLHVENTSQIGIFKIISYDYKEGIFRMRFKLTEDNSCQYVLENYILAAACRCQRLNSSILS